MGSKATSDFRRNRKNNLIKVCGGKCCLCGYHKSNSALEFHHIKPDEKDYALAGSGTCRDIERDLIEIKKCILVCANCHREIHDGNYTEEQLLEKQIFNEDFANELIYERNKKLGLIKEELKCYNCGAKITKDSKSGLCSTCSSIASRKTVWPDRETLKKLIRTVSFSKIGRRYGNVNCNSVKNGVLNTIYLLKNQI